MNKQDQEDRPIKDQCDGQSPCEFGLSGDSTATRSPGQRSPRLVYHQPDLPFPDYDQVLVRCRRVFHD